MKVCIIGLGARGQKYLHAVMANEALELIAACDPCSTSVDHLLAAYHVPKYTDLKTLLSETSPDFAIVALPHDQYLPAITLLAEQGVSIMKEKPFATSVNEAQAICRILQQHPVNMMITLQRRFDPIYQAMRENLHHIGKIYCIEGRYTLNIPDLQNGWRARPQNAGGGALLDMGYHFIDLLLWYFGGPESVLLQKSSHNRENQSYTAEDTVILNFSYRQPNTFGREPCMGTVTISRTGYKSQEKLLVRGSLGNLLLKKDEIRRYDNEGKLIAQLKRGTNIHRDPIVAQIQHFTDFLKGKTPILINNYQTHDAHIRLVTAAYQSAETKKPTNPQAISLATKNNDFTWPLITDRTRQAVLKQLDESISIYDRSGIIQTFEERFADYHQRKYALLTNSGTSALFGMFEGLALKPGDEVIVPTYTFFATATPLLYLGATPVFCDCLPDGNINPQQIVRKITDKTRAVVITHMWGLPCDMDEIIAICQRYQLKLLEDCSHAHGALYKGKKVGSFGDAAIWSLQGQKIVTGGEGGILLTDDETIYARATLQGQYNKRCKQTIPESNPLSKFNWTGFGLKLRVHPLAVAIANEQFDHLDQWLIAKRGYAEHIINALANVDFLIPPNTTHKMPSWYALVFRYDETRAGFPIENFIAAAHEAGLTALERPISTSPLHRLPLFTAPNEAMPRLYHTPAPCIDNYPEAERFYHEAVKLPVWVRVEDKAMVDRYIQGILSIAKQFKTHRKENDMTMKLSMAS